MFHLLTSLSSHTNQMTCIQLVQLINYHLQLKSVNRLRSFRFSTISGLQVRVLVIQQKTNKTTFGWIRRRKKKPTDSHWMPNKITLNSEQTPSFHDVTFSLTSRKRRTKTHYASTILKFIHWWEAAKLWELQPPVTMTQWLVSWQRARRAKVRSAEVGGGTRAPPQHWCRKQKPGVCCWYKPAPLWLLRCSDCWNCWPLGCGGHTEYHQYHHFVLTFKYPG